MNSALSETKLLLSVSVWASVSACGGSGGGDPPTPPAPPIHMVEW
ncbi:hypothetical protein [Ruminobacter sp.]